MAKQIVWTKRAQAERKEILQFWRIRNQSTAYSKKLNELIKKAVKLVAAHPHIGRHTDIENIRVKLVRDYLIFYEESEEQIFILSIWDNRRNPEDAPY
jgi:addiction module RelE/StbE family toxin